MKLQKTVRFIDLRGQYLSIKEEIDKVIQEVLLSSNFAAGPFVKAFEKNFAASHGSEYCVGVNSGTSALHSVLLALKVGYGDEVVVPANTFFATPEAVSLTGAKPVFVDCEPDYYNIDPDHIERVITPKTKALIAVHLYGQPAKVDRIKELTEKNNIHLIEDCAQAHLATYRGLHVGNFGICGCFSFYPGKNLGACGEAGAVTTNDKGLYRKILSIRDHGSAGKYYHDCIGHNYRMEGLQGGILNVKLKYLSGWTEKRRENAGLYRYHLKEVSEVILPEENKDVFHVYHLFVIRAKGRDELAEFLGRNGIHTGIHYPIPCHLQKAYSFLGCSKGDFPISEKYASEILSLPMYPELKEEEISYVSNKVKEFYNA